MKVGTQNDHFAGRLRLAFSKDLEADDFYEVVPRLDLIEKKWKLWRLEKSGVRFYYNPDSMDFYPSTTSVTWSQLPEGEYLEKWKLNMAVKKNDTNAPKEYMNERASYGTLMHILFTEAMLYGRVHTDEIEGAVMLYRELYELWDCPVRSWIPELKKDISAFFTFIHEKEVQPLAIEMPIYYPVYMPVSLTGGQAEQVFVGWVSGTMDMIAEITHNRSRVNAIIDYKSGKKGFFDSHMIQVNSYMHGWNWIQKEKLNNQFRVEKCFNFAPKNSYGPLATYNFKDMTGAEVYNKYPHLLKQFMIDENHIVPDIRTVEGEFVIGETGNNNVKKVSAVDYIEQHYSKED